MISQGMATHCRLVIFHVDAGSGVEDCLMVNVFVPEYLATRLQHDPTTVSAPVSLWYQHHSVSGNTWLLTRHAEASASF